MPILEELKNQARVKARSILSQSESFRNMDKQQQFAFYKDLVDSTYQELVQHWELEHRKLVQQNSEIDT